MPAAAQVKTAFEHFKAISNMKAIQEQHYKEKAKIANDDSLTSGLSDHDLWFGEMKYVVLRGVRFRELWFGEMKCVV